jgi:hypothetical protein
MKASALISQISEVALKYFSSCDERPRTRLSISRLAVLANLSSCPSRIDAPVALFLESCHQGHTVGGDAQNALIACPCVSDSDLLASGASWSSRAAESK